MSEYEDSDQPAAAYSAAVAGWLHQVYHAQMMHYGNIYLLSGLSHQPISPQASTAFLHIRPSTGGCPHSNNNSSNNNNHKKLQHLPDNNNSKIST